MKRAILLAASVLFPLVGCRDDSFSGKPASSPGKPLEEAYSGAETEDRGVQDRIKAIREELRRTEENVMSLEETRDYQLEKLALLEAKKAKTEKEAAVLGKRLAALEELWGLDRY